MKVLRVIGTAVVIAIFLALVVGAWFGLNHWYVRSSRPEKPTEVVKPEQPKPAGKELVITPDPEQVEMEAFRKELRALSLAKKWDALEARAEELRKSKALFSGGSWKIRHFYEAINPYQDLRPWVQATRQWATDRPQSVTAHIAHAEALMEYAWAARGNADANKLSPEVAKLFMDQLDEAWGVLEKAKTLPTKDPHWWNVALGIGVGLGMEREKYDQLFDEAVAFEPAFFSYYLQKARYLLPGWHGKEGDWERFAADVAQKEGGPGKSIYARIVTDMARLDPELFTQKGTSWELTKAGFEDLLQKYPESLYWRSIYGYFACKNKDQEVARKIFKELKGRVVLSAWGKEEAFMECRDWALAGSDTQ